MDAPRILPYREPFDYTELNRYLNIFIQRYPFLGVTSLGESILGNGIPVFVLGKGNKDVFYIGAHHGMEWITSILLTRFVNDFSETLAVGKSVYRISPENFCEQFTIHVIPMLNPDGVGYQIHGVAEDNPIRSRVLAMNGGSTDFSHWQANARGVDLNHNYDAGFSEYKKLETENGIIGGSPTRYSGEAPESEPEVAALCNYIRFHNRRALILTLHTQGEEIYYQSGGITPIGASAVAHRISRLSGYRLSKATGLSSYGGLTDWCVSKFGIPSLTIECGRGVNPLPLSDFFPIYASLREALFTAPLSLC